MSRYFKSREVKGDAMNMFPPGNIIFVRPLKQYDGEGKKLDMAWDTVWVTPEEMIGEGILISPKACPCLPLPHTLLLQPATQSLFGAAFAQDAAASQLAGI